MIVSQPSPARFATIRPRRHPFFTACESCKRYDRRPSGTQRLQRRVLAAGAAHDGLFLEVEFALDPAARFVGDLAVAQELIEEFALGLDQVQPQAGVQRAPRSAPSFGLFRQQAAAMVCARLAAATATSSGEAALARELRRAGAAPASIASQRAASSASRSRRRSSSRMAETPSQRITAGSSSPSPTSVSEDDAEGDDQDQVAIGERLRRSRASAGSRAQRRARRRRARR